MTVSILLTTSILSVLAVVTIPDASAFHGVPHGGEFGGGGVFSLLF